MLCLVRSGWLLPVAWLAAACGSGAYAEEAIFPSDHAGPSSYVVQPAMGGGVVAAASPKTGLKVRPET